VPTPTAVAKRVDRPSGAHGLEGGLDPDQRDHVGAKPIPLSGQDDVGEAKTVSCRGSSARRARGRSAGAVALEAEDRGREPLPGAGVDAGDVKEPRGSDALEGLAPSMARLP